MEYKDFELLATGVQTVKEEGKKRILFRVQVPRSPAGELVEGVPSEYDAREMRKRLKDWERRALDWPDVIRLGHWLGTTLFPEPVRDLLVRSLDLARAGEKGLRIRLLLEGALHNVPWEYILLNRGGGEATMSDFLGLTPNVSIVRHQAATLPAWEVEAELPARMIVALASPAGYASLDLDEERRAIERALEGNPHVEATFAADATPETLLSDVGRAHLFHFAGHGDFERRMGAQPGTVEGEGVIILDDGYGDPVPLSAGELALQLRRVGVRAAVLGACRSGRRGDVNVWSSVAAALLKAELGAVVGMQYTIRDKSGIAFAGEFYRALVAGLPVDEAVANGRLAIARDDVRGWGVPVLYLRAPDGVIFPEHTADLTLEEARGQLRVTARQRVKELRGKAVTVDIGEMTEGVVEAEQEIDTVTEGGEATVVKIKRMGVGAPIPAAPKPSTQVTVTQEVGSAEGGKVTGVEVGQVTGDVTIESTVNQIESHVIQGDYVDRDVITNNILVLGDPHALDEILRSLMTMQGVDERALKNLGALAVPEHVSHQIAEVMAAQKEVAARGVPATPQALYRLGMLAAYRRDYDEALGYFRQATQADPEYSDAFEAIAWLQQSQAMDDIHTRDYDAAISRLADARTAATRTDPLDPQALALRGYIAKTLAQIAEARDDKADRQKYYQEAARFFEHVVQLEPNNASAHNGLGNVEYALGNLDTAIAAYSRAIELAPRYAAAHHDLALAFEARMRADPAHADEWCQKALQAWRRTYQLAPDDPGFSADYILTIGQRISWLERRNQ